MENDNSLRCKLFTPINVWRQTLHEAMLRNRMTDVICRLFDTGRQVLCVVVVVVVGGGGEAIRRVRQSWYRFLSRNRTVLVGLHRSSI